MGNFCFKNLTPRANPMMASLTDGKILIAGDLDSNDDRKNGALIMMTGRQDTSGEVVCMSKFAFSCTS